MITYIGKRVTCYSYATESVIESDKESKWLWIYEFKLAWVS